MRSVVIFDLDGTLVDSIGLIVASFQHAFREVLGHEVDDRTAQSWIGTPLYPVFERMAPAHAAELEDSYRAWNLANSSSRIRAYDGVPDLLNALMAADRAMGIVTSKRRTTAQLALDLTNLAPMIEIWAAMEDTTDHKPDPQPLHFATNLQGLEPGDCVYVGDTSFDIAAASAAGMASIGVTWGAGHAADLRHADAVVHTADELATALAAPTQRVD